MLKFFKKKNKSPLSQPESFNAYAFADLKREPQQPSEPFTIAQYRLENGARDFGSGKGVKAYNSHKAKINNQWINPLQSVNSGYGNAQYAIYNYQNVNYFECYTLAQDPLFNKIFNILSNTPFAKGGTVSDELTPEEEDNLDKGIKKFKVLETMRNAVRSNYVCGGCLVYMDFGLDNLEEPLDFKKIDMRRFKGFRHIDPINVVAVKVNTSEPARWDYMKPEKWYVVGLGTVDTSHFLKFEDNIPELMMRPMTMYFGMPLTLLIKQDVANSNLASQGLANLLNRFRYLYLKTGMENFTGAGAVNFRNRLETMAMVQDNFSIYPIKDSEDIQQFTTSMAGMAENAEFFYQIIAAKTDITLSILLGKGAQGLSGTLEGERKNFYDRIRCIQESVKNNLLTMLGIVYGYMADGVYKEFTDYIFNPLEEANEREKAENLRSYVEAARAIAEFGVSPDKMIDWLKQFKDYHLDNIEIDLETPALESYEDYDLETGGEGADPFPLNNAWEENKHKRDKNGKFAKDNEKSSSTIKDLIIDENKLGSASIPADELRKIAVEYYKNNLAGTSVHHEELGKIIFSNSGFKKPISFSADIRKLRLFPYLPEIIKNGKVITEENDKRDRVNVQKFYTLVSEVVLDGKKEKIRVNIRKDSNGNLYYDHVINKPRMNSDRLNKSGLTRGVNNSMPEESVVVNIFYE